MIVIRDQQLRLCPRPAGAELQVPRRTSRRHAAAGFTAQQVESCDRSAPRAVKLSEMTEPRVAVPDRRRVARAWLRQVDYLSKRSRQLEFFIRHGATSSMLTKLFKISSAT
jgi:hypothetical protein